MSGPEATCWKDEGTTVLVVDDDEGVRQVTAEMLRAVGWKVEEASDVEAAAASLRKGSIDVVVTDTVL